MSENQAQTPGISPAEWWGSKRERPWQILHHEPIPLAQAVALDEILAPLVASGELAPHLRVWEPTGTGAVLGSHQSVSREIDMAAAERLGVDVIRRRSGGGTMFSEDGRCFAYSLIFPTAWLARLNPTGAYEILDWWVVRALQAMGVPAFYRPLNDIATDAGKLCGAAQRRYAAGVTVHHALMSHSADPKVIFAVLRTWQPDIPGKGTRSAKKHVDALTNYVDLTRAEVCERLRAAFAELTGAGVGQVSEELLGAAAERAEENRAPAWRDRLA